MTKKTVIFDLDGTLCDISHRLHFVKDGNRNWDGFYAACVDDVAKPSIIELLFMCQDAGHKVIISSGRSENVRQQTLDWLNRHDIIVDELIMRPNGSYIPDQAMKKAWLDQGRLGNKEDILFIVEDRDRMVKMWRDQGLICLQVDQWVEEGEISFPLKKVEQAQLMAKFISDTKQDQRFNEWSSRNG